MICPRTSLRFGFLGLCLFGLGYLFLLTMICSSFAGDSTASYEDYQSPQRLIDSPTRTRRVFKSPSRQLDQKRDCRTLEQRNQDAQNVRILINHYYKPSKEQQAVNAARHIIHRATEQ